MKLNLIFLLCLSTSLATAQLDTLRIKMRAAIGNPGYTGSSEMVDFRNLSERNPWRKTEQELSGIPEGWDEYYRNDVWFQAYQFAYQNYKTGNMDSARMAGLMKSWQFDTVSGYSKVPIKCYTTMIFRKLNSLNVEYMVDTDSDLDFSDEEVLRPFTGINFRNADSLVPYAPKIIYQVWSENQMVEDTVPFLVELNNSENLGTYLTYYIPQYFMGSYDGDTLIVNCDRPDYQDFVLSRLSDLDTNLDYHNGKKLERGLRIELSGTWYIIEDFERASQELVLCEIDVTKDTVYPQKGFYAPDFSFSDIEIGEKHTLYDYRGKYVLLDFWGTWCGPCVKGIPDLVKLNEELADENFEIISVACFSKEEDVLMLKNKHGMDWANAMTVDRNGLLKKFAINTYPSYFLIDPRGKIVETQLSRDKTTVLKIVRGN